MEKSVNLRTSPELDKSGEDRRGGEAGDREVLCEGVNVRVTVEMV